jgi:hypothetical protein
MTSGCLLEMSLFLDAFGRGAAEVICWVCWRQQAHNTQTTTSCNHQHCHPCPPVTLRTSNASRSPCHPTKPQLPLLATTDVPHLSRCARLKFLSSPTTLNMRHNTQTTITRDHRPCQYTAHAFCSQPSSIALCRSPREPPVMLPSLVFPLKAPINSSASPTQALSPSYLLPCLDTLASSTKEPSRTIPSNPPPSPPPATLTLDTPHACSLCCPAQHAILPSTPLLTLPNSSPTSRQASLAQCLAQSLFLFMNQRDVLPVAKFEQQL